MTRRGPIRLHGVALDPPLVLAPLAGWTSLPFRELVRAIGGVGLAVTEVVSAKALAAGDKRTWGMVQTSTEDSPLAVQINARAVADAAEAARRLEAFGAAIIDLNLGCPVRKISGKGGGAALLRDAGHARQIAAAVVGAVSIPVTAKLRLGWGESELTAPSVAVELEEAGVAAITVHGRTRSQVFSGAVSWGGIRAVVDAVSIPVIANGDVVTVRGALAALEQTGAKGLMVGRGAIENPWLLRDIAAAIAGAATPAPPTLEERADFVRRHYQALVRHAGERRGTLQFRKILRLAGTVLGADARFRHDAVRIEGRGDVLRLLARLLEDPGTLCPPTPGGHVPTPKRPVDHW